MSQLLPILLIAFVAQTPNSVVRFKAYLQEKVASQTNFTCDLTIERFVKRSRHEPFREVERARLRSSFIHPREQLSWRDGGGDIEDSVAARIAGGSIRSLEFVVHARGLLTRSEASFAVPPGDSRFQFNVPAPESDWILQTDGKDGTRLGYAGTVWFEVLLRKFQLTANGRDLHGLGLSQAVKTLEYGWIRDDEGPALLVPGKAEVQYVVSSGSEVRTVSRFENCRPYPLAVGLPQTPSVQLPQDFQVPVELANTIDSDIASVGDSVSFRLLAPVYHDGQMQLKTGTLVGARISRLEVVDGRRRLEFSTESPLLQNRRNNIGLNPGETRSTLAATSEKLELPARTQLVLRSSAW